MIMNGKVLLFGVLGAAISCAMTITKGWTFVMETLISKMATSRLQPILNRVLSNSVASDCVTSSLVLHAMVGFMAGATVMLACLAVRVLMVRFLLGYNGWFFTPKNPINKVAAISII